MYLYRVVDKKGNTVDFLLTKRRSKLAANKFLIKAISNNGSPRLINIDKRGANREAIRTYNKRCLKRIRIRQCKYLNNRVEQDHKFIKWRIHNTLSFKSFKSASRTLTGIEIVRMIKKEQVTFPGLLVTKHSVLWLPDLFCLILIKLQRFVLTVPVAEETEDAMKNYCRKERRNQSFIMVLG
jgi:putative transposase